MRTSRQRWATLGLLGVGALGILAWATRDGLDRESGAVAQPEAPVELAPLETSQAALEERRPPLSIEGDAPVDEGRPDVQRTASGGLAIHGVTPSGDPWLGAEASALTDAGWVELGLTANDGLTSEALPAGTAIFLVDDLLRASRVLTDGDVEAGSVTLAGMRQPVLTGSVVLRGGGAAIGGVTVLARELGRTTIDPPWDAVMSTATGRGSGWHWTATERDGSFGLEGAPSDVDLLIYVAGRGVAGPSNGRLVKRGHARRDLLFEVDGLAAVTLVLVDGAGRALEFAGRPPDLRYDPHAGGVDEFPLLGGQVPATLIERQLGWSPAPTWSRLWFRLDDYGEPLVAIEVEIVIPGLDPVSTAVDALPAEFGEHRQEVRAAGPDADLAWLEIEARAANGDLASGAFLANGELLLIPVGGEPMLLVTPPAAVSNPFRFDGIPAGDYGYSFRSYESDLRFPPIGSPLEPVHVSSEVGALVTIPVAGLGSLSIRATKGKGRVPLNGLLFAYYTLSENVIQTDSGYELEKLRRIMRMEPPYTVDGLSAGDYVLKPHGALVTGLPFVEFSIVEGETTSVELPLAD